MTSAKQLSVAEFPTYEEYKDSGVEWLGEVPKEWEVTRLKNKINSCINGFWGAEPNGLTDIVVLRVADFDYQKLSISSEKLTYRSITNSDRRNRLLSNGDLIIEKSGGGDKTLVGRVVLFEENYDALTSNFLAKISIKENTESTYIKYVFANLYANDINYKSIKQTTGIQNLDHHLYFNEEYCFPSKKEQSLIAQFLDEKTALIDQAIAIKEQQIKLLNERKQIIIQQAVIQGLDPNVPMKDSGVEWIGQIPEHWKLVLGFTVFEENKQLNKGMIENTVLSLSYGRIIIRPLEKLTGLVPESFETYQLVEPGDIIVRCMDLQNDKTSLRTAIARDKGIITSAYLNLKTKINALQDYLQLFLYVMDITKEIYRYGSGLRQNLSYLDFKHLKILMPPIEEQKKIVEFLEDVDRKTIEAILLLENQIQSLKEYKTTLINSAVTGKIKITPEMVGA